MKRYVGNRANDRRVEIFDGERLTGTLPLRTTVANHSPTGFEWGFGGSGPAQLALALCIDALDGDVRRALGVYQMFKWRVISHLDGDRWELTQPQILTTLAELETEKRDRAAAPPTADLTPPF